MFKETRCQLYSRRGSLQHTLSSCPKALGDGRYRWRHDLVLRAIASQVTDAISESKYQPRRKINRIIFVKEGARAKKQSGVRSSMLSSADDWQLVVVLDTQLRFPRHIAETSLRPDLVLYSDSMKRSIIWELTVSWEEHMIIANERKRSIYQELVEQCQRKSVAEGSRVSRCAKHSQR